MSHNAGYTSAACDEDRGKDRPHHPRRARQLAGEGEPMKTENLQLDRIVTTAGTQVRAKLDNDTVDQYAADMLDGAKFPAVAVFHDGTQYILADGFHRVMAANRNGFKDINAEIHKGTKSDALKYALAANATHGLKRTNADKRRSVELALGEWSKLSDRELAKICAVSDHLVGDVREKSTAIESQLEPPARIGTDGKTRKLPKPSIKEPTPRQSSNGVTKETADKLLEAMGEAVPKPAVEPEPAPSAYTLAILRADLAQILAQIKSDITDPKQLGFCARELSVTAKMVEELKYEARVNAAN